MNLDFMYYLSTDHLGSINLIVDGSNGNVLDDLSYDAWGRNRNPVNWTYSNITLSSITDRGYTSHEQLPSFGLINMNGRVYDPMTMNFLSPDPVLQNPSNSQNYNRYSYCLNNPLKYVDPSGYATLYPWYEHIAGPNTYYTYFHDISDPTYTDGSGRIWKYKAESFETANFIGNSDGSWVYKNFEKYQEIIALFNNYAETQTTRQDNLSQSNNFKFTAGAGPFRVDGVGIGRNPSQSNNVSPFDVGVEWLTGNGPRHRDFTNGDLFTEMLRQREHVLSTKSMIPYMIANGYMAGKSPYRLDGLQGVGKYIKDYSTLATGGLTGNLAVTYLGSYNLEWKVSSIYQNTATVDFLVNNTSTIQSATRPPLIDYYSWWQNSVGSLINSFFSHGPMSPTTQTFRWTETISW